jgi:hypothetical protein
MKIGRRTGKIAIGADSAGKPLLDVIYARLDELKRLVMRRARAVIASTIYSAARLFRRAKDALNTLNELSRAFQNKSPVSGAFVVSIHRQSDQSTSSTTASAAPLMR